MKAFFRARYLLFLLGLCGFAGASYGKSPVEISGLGFFRTIDMERRLSFLRDSPEGEEAEMDMLEVEDMAYIILQLLQRDGYANPEVIGQLSYLDGSTAEFSWSLPFSPQDPELINEKPIEEVKFRCRPGILNFYRQVEVVGIDVMEPQTVQDFFKPSGYLFTRKRDLSFTEGNFSARISRLLSALRSAGYQQAAVFERNVNIDPETGAVDVRLRINQGRIHRVASVQVEIRNQSDQVEDVYPLQSQPVIFNSSWLRERRQEVINSIYEEGYPDATIVAEHSFREDEKADTVPVDVKFKVFRGPQIVLEEVRFEPDGLVKESVLKRQVDLKEDALYNLLEVETGRRRLLSLGVFEQVDLHQVEVGENQRTVTYLMEPLPWKTLSLRVGWGSYEQGRIGLRWEHLNIWGRAHRYEVDLKQSFKATEAQLNYIVPQFFDQDITAYFKADYDFREEISYERTTSGLTFGASRRLSNLGIEISAEYSLENQDTTRESEEEFESTDQATVSSLSFRAILDRRDSPLYPTSGHDISLYSKTASESIGGNANFQKLEATASYHKYLGSALYLHLSVRYGTIFSGSPTKENLPFNERFFPGGENTVRGYKRGEATPLSSEGQPIGAEAYALGNFELEQRIFRNFSAILFWDGVGLSADHVVWPGEEFLQSVGLGLRWRTPVGPIRLEYGHNPDPRPADPKGTLHFAVGYPF